MAGKSKYSTHEIVNVFRSVSLLIQHHPELLDNKGIFRITGSKPATEELLKQLIDQDFDWNILEQYVFVSQEMNSDNVHNTIGMFNCVLKDSLLLDATDDLLTGFTKKLQKLLTAGDLTSESVLEAVYLLDEFINNLLLSKSLEHQRTGEILYHYCYLMHRASSFEETNMMSARNLAIILAPHLTSELELVATDDLLVLTEFTMGKLVPILESYINSQLTECSFSVRHADKINHLIATRHFIMNKLIEMKLANKKQTIDPMVELMVQAKEMQNQQEQLKITIHDEPHDHDEKKNLKKQLKKLQKDIEELNQEIIVLRDQIEEMNDAHAGLIVVNRKLSLSVDNLAQLVYIPGLSDWEQNDPSLPASTSARQRYGVFRENSNADLSQEADEANELAWDDDTDTTHHSLS
ncbi:RhoGAP domain-containing protein [Legionella quateirensis]|uniref:RhoGAP domain protein (GTPase activator of small GTPases) n=1 Tax=Legionella quateirensis TaxID=45072 RepID=A0A378L1L2_9GAMM|nr:RhoGAP domain-containing protein [Legionella quateirensis]KTD50765.1 RhoGAP domain protein (GTPase activator of small GTPases) [Legionella quateirensis]STY17990.1 RhoGAP domain protein (GTPase activator of small GTPases) [Legionella quateirensis]